MSDRSVAGFVATSKAGVKEVVDRPPTRSGRRWRLAARAGLVPMAATVPGPRNRCRPRRRGQPLWPRFSSATSYAAVADDQFGDTSTRVARMSRVMPETVNRSAKAG